MERAKRIRRLRWAGVGMIAVALAAVAIWKVWPRERLLTEVALPIVKIHGDTKKPVGSPPTKSCS